MATSRAYLDHNATTPVRPEVVEAMLRAMELVGNPSSVHGEGRAARAAIEQARDEVAAVVGARPRDVVFTSGGSEANATALSPSLRRAGDTRSRAMLLASAGEHASVLGGHRFPAVEMVPVDQDGVIRLDVLRSMIEERRHDADLRLVVTLQAANSETGVIQPMAQVAPLVREAGGVTVCDAVQVVGKVPVDIRALGVDVLTLSAHKFGGPKGVGALVIRPDIEIGRLIGGGGQEANRRAGTENVAAIVGMGVAARLAAAELDAQAERLRALRDRLEADIASFAPSAVVFGRRAARLPNTTLVSVPGVTAETLLMALDLAGFAVSSGSACSSGKVRRSHVLDAMGVSADLAEGAVRISLGRTTDEDEVQRFAAAFEQTVAAFHDRRSRAA